MSGRKEIILSALFHANGGHKAAWRTPGAEAGADTDIAHYVRAARRLEAGLFDLMFIADTPAARTDNLETWTRSPVYQNRLEPLTLLTALAMVTSRIGLGGTVSTSFFEPFNIARQFASLDHISHGRAAWNVVTSANDYAARNFGLDRLPPHERRYAKARECVEVVKAYWETWEDDAFIFDKANARQFDPARFHAVEHHGEFFDVSGGLNMARCPQGQPVIIQAGASSTGMDLAAETADIVFGTGSSTEAARAFYDDLKRRMARHGRDPSHLAILSGLEAVVGATEKQAEEKFQDLQSRVHPELAILYLGMDLETDLRDLPLDEPIPLDRIPAAANNHTAYFNQIADMVRAGRMSLREIATSYRRGNRVMRGTPVQIADFMEDWVAKGCGDGFMLHLPTVPGSIDDFVDQVIPVLQERGSYKTAYRGTTLRDHLGLPRPAHPTGFRPTDLNPSQGRSSL